MSTGAEVARLFARDASLWTDSGEDEWLGWIDAVDDALRGLPSLKLWAEPLGARHERVVLCGMGGSSLAPLVIGELYRSDRLHVLDSTDPEAVRAVPVEGSLFVIASKSGSTIEPNCFADAFWGKTEGDGSRFVAITDPGSALEERARKDGWARIAHGRPDVGGRYSALTAFGLVPAVLAGIDIELMLERAVDTLAKCRDELGVNPGQTLAHVIGNAHAKGRDKLTFVVPPALASVGLWLEQLIAESTGKQGTGVLPVAGEPLGEPSVYGDDRLFIHFRQGTGHDEQDAGLDVLRSAGQPVFTVAAGGRPGRHRRALRRVGGRDGARRRAAAHQPLRPAERAGGEGSHGRDPRGLRARRQAAGRGARIAERRARAAPSAVTPTSACRRSWPPRPSARRCSSACRAVCATGSAARSRRASARATSTPRASTTRAAHRPGLFVQLLAGEQDDEAIPGRPFGFRTLRDAQALGDAGALRGRGLPVARIPMAACEAAIERALEHIATTRITT